LLLLLGLSLLSEGGGAWWLRLAVVDVQQTGAPHPLEVGFARASGYAPEVRWAVVCRGGYEGRHGSLDEEGVVDDFMERGSFRWLGREDLLDEVLHC
jgi:hypothetical protein